MCQIVCLCAALLLTSVSSFETTLYKKEGDDVVLKPNANTSVTGPISSIIWRYGPNLAAQWKSESHPSIYSHFKNRGSLNTTNGEMTIRGLNLSDSAKYDLTIDNVLQASIHLIVLSPVPVPMVTESCDGEGSCTLTCQADVSDVKLVTYRWMSDGTWLKSSSKDLHVTKDDSVDRKEFHCELENPVSQETSPPMVNPFNTKTTTPDRKVNVNVGLTVFICLLTSVLLLAFIHRCKAGMWFFQKVSMPWTSDFWTKDEGAATEAAVNGNTSHNGKGREDEETAMDVRGSE